MGASSSYIIKDDYGYESSGFHPEGAVQLVQSHEEIIKRLMSERGLRPTTIPFRFSRRNVRGHGKAKCQSCGRKWTSYQASAILDLKEQKVERVWKQKCANCKTPVAMIFTTTEFEEVVSKNLDNLQRLLRGERLPNTETRGQGPPHRKDLCEGCDWGRSDCRSSADNETSISAIASEAASDWDTGIITAGAARGTRGDEIYPSDGGEMDTSGSGLGTAIAVGVGIAALFAIGSAVFGGIDRNRRP